MSDQHPTCPDCGKECASTNQCFACGWHSECGDDHDWKLESGDWSVGLSSHIFCEACGVIVDDDGRFDSDFEDNVI